MRNKNIISVTESAVLYIKSLLKNDREAIGIRVKVESGGCSGNKYVFEYVTEKNSSDEEIVYNDIRLFVDSTSVLKLIGTTLDYVDDPIKSGFVFLNPNEKSSCGCGASFAL